MCDEASYQIARVISSIIEWQLPAELGHYFKFNVILNIKTIIILYKSLLDIKQYIKCTSSYYIFLPIYLA